MQDAAAAGWWTGYSWVQNSKIEVVATEIAGSPWKKYGLDKCLKSCVLSGLTQ